MIDETKCMKCEYMKFITKDGKFKYMGCTFGTIIRYEDILICPKGEVKKDG